MEITPFLKEGMLRLLSPCLMDGILNYNGTDTQVFTNDLIQTIKHRSYVPGSRPPPPAQPVPTPQPSFGAPISSQPYLPTGPATAGRKRGFQDRGDYDAPNGREQYHIGGRPFKQPRRGGGRKGYVDPDRPQPVQELQYGYPNSTGLDANAPAFAPGGPALDMTGFMANGDPMEAMRKLQELQQQIGLQMASFPNFSQQQIYPPQRQQPQKRRGRCRDYDNKGYCARGHNCMYEHSSDTEAMFNNLPMPQMSGQIQLPAGGQFVSDFILALDGDVTRSGLLQHSDDAHLDALRPRNSGPVVFGGGFCVDSVLDSEVAAHEYSGCYHSSGFVPLFGGLSIPGLGMEPQGGCPAYSTFNFAWYNTLDEPILTQQTDNKPSPAELLNFSVSHSGFSIPAIPQADAHDNSASNQRRDNRQGRQLQKRSGANRAPFSFLGQMHDRSQTKLVVECIPEVNFDEKQVRDFFSQFGKVEEITLMAYKRLAIVKFDTWYSANEAYNSPNVIFNNRFVKLFWYKEEKHTDLAKGGGANGAQRETSITNGSRASADAPEPEIDMEEFKKQQETAQRAHEDKMRQKKELAEKQTELDKKRKELQAKQEAEKQKLAKLAASKKASLAFGAEDTPKKEESAEPTNTSSQTESLRATLARLQEEAKSIGLDPHSNTDEDTTILTYSEYSPYSPYSSYAPRGGRGGYFRGGRGGYIPRGAYRGRGGASGRGNIHAAYAAFSLDNRPKKVALTGVDFSAPEKDEALRQHLFSLGEFSAEIQVTPAKTHVNFNDRKAAENFFNTVGGALPGDKVEVAWVANTAGPLLGSATSKIEATGSTSRNGGAADEEGGLDAIMADAAEGKQNGGHGHSQLDGGGEEDYDVAGDNEWDIA